MRKINSVLEEVLKKIESSKEELKYLESIVNNFCNKINRRIKILGINAEVFVGGSFAKKTILKKEKYDIDLFIIFGKEHEDENLSKITKKILKDFKKIKKIHGSRDYFHIDINENIFIEIIPVMKIKNPKEAKNITDLSYYHVSYVNKKIRFKRLSRDIILAKAFCYANKCYGAESYISGFSGYALELLIIYYGGFLKMLKAISKSDDEKIIIDIEKHYIQKSRILLDLNASKLKSPIILIDPTFKQRNVLAALSKEKFNIFKKACVEFLKNPEMQSFVKKELNIKRVSEKAKSDGKDFILIEIKTNRQEGDIAGSKLLKFYKHLNEELERFFNVTDCDFEYKRGKSAICYFIAKNKGEKIVEGPLISDKKNVERFKKKHKKVLKKKGRIYSHEKFDGKIEDFIIKFKNKKRLKEMDITSLEIKSD